MISLVEKIGRLSDRLVERGLAHAFGGALALAWCTGQPRGTADIDLNVFIEIGDLQRLLDALPPEVSYHETDVGSRPANRPLVRPDRLIVLPGRR